MEPSTGYARLGDDRIYYQVLGDGPIDLIINTGGWGSIDVEWDDPAIRLFHRRLAGFTRVIKFDGRGSGASDSIPVDALPPWESFVEELDRVMDDVGSERAAIFGIADGGPVSMLFAASRPDRVSALIVGNTFARLLAGDDYPFGFPVGEAEVYFGEVAESWGTGELTAQWAPSRANDPSFLEWLAKVERSVYTPTEAEAYALAFYSDRRPGHPSSDPSTHPRASRCRQPDGSHRARPIHRRPHRGGQVHRVARHRRLPLLGAPRPVRVGG